MVRKKSRVLSGGNLDENGNHTVGTSFENDVSKGFAIAYKNNNKDESNVRVTLTGGLRAKSGEIIATSKQVYDYIKNRSTEKKFWYQAVSRERAQNQARFVQDDSYPTFFRTKNGEFATIKTTFLDSRGSRGTSWIYLPADDIFVREEGRLLGSDEELLIPVSYEEILGEEDDFYKDLHKQENAAYAKKVNDEVVNEKGSTNIESTVQTGIFTLSALAAGVGGVAAALGATDNSTDYDIPELVPYAITGAAAAAAALSLGKYLDRRKEQTRTKRVSEASEQNRIAQQELRPGNQANPLQQLFYPPIPVNPILGLESPIDAIPGQPTAPSSTSRIPSQPTKPANLAGLIDAIPGQSTAPSSSPIPSQPTEPANLAGLIDAIPGQPTAPSSAKPLQPANLGIADVASTVTNALTAVIPSAPAAESAPVKPIQAVSKILNPVTSLLSTTARTVAGLSQPRMNRIQPRLVRTKTPVQVLMDEVLKKKLERERQRSPVQRSPIRRSPYPIVRVRRVITPRKNKTRSRSLKKKSRFLKKRSRSPKKKSRSQKKKSKNSRK